MRLPRRRERFLDADVELLIASPKPNATATTQRLWLLDLAKLEQLAEEPARVRLASPRRCELHMVDAFDEHRSKI